MESVSSRTGNDVDAHGPGPTGRPDIRAATFVIAISTVARMARNTVRAAGCVLWTSLCVVHVHADDVTLAPGVARPRQALRARELARRQIEWAAAVPAVDAEAGRDEWRRGQQDIARDMAELLGEFPDGVALFKAWNQHRAMTLAQAARFLADDTERLFKDGQQWVAFDRMADRLDVLSLRQRVLARWARDTGGAPELGALLEKVAADIDRRVLTDVSAGLRDVEALLQASARDQDALACTANVAAEAERLADQHRQLALRMGVLPPSSAVSGVHGDLAPGEERPVTPGELENLAAEIEDLTDWAQDARPLAQRVLRVHAPLDVLRQAAAWHAQNRHDHSGRAMDEALGKADAMAALLGLAELAERYRHLAHRQQALADAMDEQAREHVRVSDAAAQAKREMAGIAERRAADALSNAADRECFAGRERALKDAANALADEIRRNPLVHPAAARLQAGAPRGSGENTRGDDCSSIVDLASRAREAADMMAGLAAGAEREAEANFAAARRVQGTGREEIPVSARMEQDAAERALVERRTAARVARALARKSIRLAESAETWARDREAWDSRQTAINEQADRRRRTQERLIRDQEDAARTAMEALRRHEWEQGALMVEAGRMEQESEPWTLMAGLPTPGLTDLMGQTVNAMARHDLPEVARLTRESAQRIEAAADALTAVVDAPTAILRAGISFPAWRRAVTNAVPVPTGSGPRDESMNRRPEPEPNNRAKPAGEPDVPADPPPPSPDSAENGRDRPAAPRPRARDGHDVWRDESLLAVRGLALDQRELAIRVIERGDAYEHARRQAATARRTGREINDDRSNAASKNRLDLAMAERQAVEEGMEILRTLARWSEDQDRLGRQWTVWTRARGARSVADRPPSDGGVATAMARAARAMRSGSPRDAARYAWDAADRLDRQGRVEDEAPDPEPIRVDAAADRTDGRSSEAVSELAPQDGGAAAGDDEPRDWPALISEELGLRDRVERIIDELHVMEADAWEGDDERLRERVQAMEPLILSLIDGGPILPTERIAAERAAGFASGAVSDLTVSARAEAAMKLHASARQLARLAEAMEAEVNGVGMIRGDGAPGEGSRIRRAAWLAAEQARCAAEADALAAQDRGAMRRVRSRNLAARVGDLADEADGLAVAWSAPAVASGTEAEGAAAAAACMKQAIPWTDRIVAGATDEPVHEELVQMLRQAAGMFEPCGRALPPPVAGAAVDPAVETLARACDDAHRARCSVLRSDAMMAAGRMIQAAARIERGAGPFDPGSGRVNGD